MKKLIDELEKQPKDIPSWYSEYSEQWIFDKGVEYATNIVRAHNPWHEVTELPEREDDLSTYSICVLVRTGDREPPSVAYYSYERKKWQWDYDFTAIPTHWAYLPEA